MDLESKELLDYKQRISDLELEHSSLKFQMFTCCTALDIGLFLTEKAKRENKIVTIDITVGQHQLFHYALEGTTPENDQWIIRKNRVTNRFQKSSLYISLFLRSKNRSIEEEFGLSSIDYAPFGGSYPIFLNDGRFIGTITVSGLPDHEDHQMVVDSIKWHMSMQK